MPIENEKNRCVACGAALTIPVQGGRIKCEYCGAEAVYTPSARHEGSGLVCPKCAAVNPLGAQHCSRCGIKLEFDCPKCGARNAYGVDFCIKCGVDIKKEIGRQQKEKQQQEEQQRAYLEGLRLQAEAKKVQSRAAKRVLGIVFVVFLCVALLFLLAAGGWVYQTRYSPSGRITQAARTQAAIPQVEAILRNTNPADWVQESSWSGTVYVMTTERVTTNEIVADKYPAGDLFGRLTGYQRVFTSEIFCDSPDSTWYESMQAVIFEDSEGAGRALEYMAHSNPQAQVIPADVPGADTAYYVLYPLEAGENYTDGCGVTAFDTRVVILYFSRYNVVGVMQVEYKPADTDPADIHWEDVRDPAVRMIAAIDASANP